MAPRYHGDLKQKYKHTKHTKPGHLKHKDRKHKDWKHKLDEKKS